MPTQADEAAIREQAYYFWEQDGRPEGRETEYWMRATVALSEKAQLDTLTKPAPKPAKAPAKAKTPAKAKAVAEPPAAKPKAAAKPKLAASKAKSAPAKKEPSKAKGEKPRKK
jgi:hypothetical protein